MLRKNGHHVESCMNGSLGLDRLIMGHRNNDFDVCLCDLQMPVMDGIECTRRYREYEKGNDPSSQFSQSLLILNPPLRAHPYTNLTLTQP